MYIQTESSDLDTSENKEKLWGPFFSQQDIPTHSDAGSG